MHVNMTSMEVPVLGAEIPSVGLQYVAYNKTNDKRMLSLSNSIS